MLSIKSWKALLIVSIIIPMGLLTTFRITEITREPMTVKETRTVNVVTWNMSRPSWFLAVAENTSSSYNDGGFSFQFTVEVYVYHENDPTFFGNDLLSILLAVTAQTKTGFIHSVTLTSSKTDQYSMLDIREDDDWMGFRNLTLNESANGSPQNRALFETLCTNQSRECSLWLKPWWWFYDSNNQDHWITITLETIYFNGSAYFQTNIPIRLGVVAS